MAFQIPRIKYGSRLPGWAGLLVFLAIAVFFLWEEHKAHIMGALPWVLLVLCPLVHVFMHRGHHHSDDHESPGHEPEAHNTDADTGEVR